MVKRKKRRPSLTGETTDNNNELPRTRSKTEQYDKTLCIICQRWHSKARWSHKLGGIQSNWDDYASSSKV